MLKIEIPVGLYDESYAKLYRTRKGVEQWKPSVETLQQCDRDQTGFCLACGYNGTPAEPDAARYECEECDSRKVFGTLELALMGLVY